MFDEGIQALLPPWDKKICPECAEHMDAADDALRGKLTQQAHDADVSRHEATVAYFENYHESGH